MDVGDLQDPGLDGLDFVPEPGGRDDDHRMGRLHHVDLVLADANGLDQDHVEAGGVEHVDSLQAGPRQAAEGAAGGHGTDEDAVVAGQFRHPHPVAEDGAAGKGAGRVDGDDPHPAPGVPDRLSKPPRQSRLAAARNPSQTDHMSAAGVAVDLGQGVAAFGLRRLSQRDHAGDGTDVALEDVLDQILGGIGLLAFPFLLLGAHRLDLD